MSVQPQLEYQQFPVHYQYAEVQPGEKKEVFYIHVDGGFVAFIDRIACDWFEGLTPPNTHSKLELIIDGVTRVFEYEIPINNPMVFKPPIVAKEHIRWFVTNNDVAGLTASGKMQTGSHWYGILTDGVLAKPKVLT